MTVSLDRPLVFFDLEATGVSVMDDRIVDIALLKRHVDGQEECFSSLVNPERLIPPEAIAIHHITDAMVSDQPTFRALAPKVMEFIAGCDLGGFGILRYDIPLLGMEFRRAGMTLSLEGRRLIDAMAIYHRMEPRNLTAAYKFFCGKGLDGAHRAEADARASLEVFWAQFQRYPDLPRDMEALSAQFGGKDLAMKVVDPDGKLVWREGKASFTFGKFRAVPLEEVARKEPSYLRWLARDDRTSVELKAILKEALEGRFPVKPAA